MELKRFVLEGVLSTVTPLHITHAGVGGRFLPDGNKGKGKVIISDQKIGFPISLTRFTKMNLGSTYLKSKENEIPVEEREDLENNEGRSRFDTLPIIPCTTWRGMLRRKASQIIEDHFRMEHNQKVSYQLYQGMHTGAVSNKPEGIAPTTSEIRSYRTHVFFGVFGGGPRMLSSNMIVSDALPVMESTIEAGFVPERYSDHALRGVYPNELTFETPIIRKDDFMGNTSNAADIVDNFDERFAQKRDEQIERSIAKISSGESDKGEESERGHTAMAFRQDIISGVPFFLRIELTGTDAQFGLVLAALERGIAETIGGRKALGYGQLAGQLFLNNQSLLSISQGRAEFTNMADPYLTALNDAIRSLKMEDLERYMADTPLPEKKAKKKKAESAVES